MCIDMRQSHQSITARHPCRPTMVQCPSQLPTQPLTHNLVTFSSTPLPCRTDGSGRPLRFSPRDSRGGLVKISAAMSSAAVCCAGDTPVSPPNRTSRLALLGPFPFRGSESPERLDCRPAPPSDKRAPVRRSDDMGYARTSSGITCEEKPQHVKGASSAASKGCRATDSQD